MKTYGTAELIAKNTKWQVRAEAHVIVMMKRVFSGASHERAGVLHLTVNDETCRLLHWTMQLYPLECPDMEYLQNRVTATRERMLELARIVQPGYQPREFAMAVPPREYQRLAAELFLTGKRLLLADDLGLGKTASAICALCDPCTLPALVVCPTHLPRQWQAELARFLPDLKTHILKSVKPYAFDQDNPPDVLIATYHKIHGWDTTLKGYIKTLICDEMQELRHNGTDKYDAARRIARECEYRLGLSATPIYNYGGEIFNPLTILDPDLLGTREEFDREWCRFSGRNALLKDPKAFNAWMRDQKIMLKRTRSEVSRELPPLTRIVYPIDADAEALADIQTTAAELAKIMLSEEKLSGLTKMQASSEFDMMVRKATGIAKAPHVAAFVELLLESGEPVVLFVWHRAVHDLLKDRLAQYNPVFYTGEESANQKFDALQAFIDGKTNLIIISLRSGAGIDGLQHRCRTVVIGELDWSPQVIDQDIGRVDRDGQKDPVTAYILVTDSGSDPILSEMLGLKKEQSDGLLNIETDVLEIQTDQSKSLKLLAEQYLKKAKVAK